MTTVQRGLVGLALLALPSCRPALDDRPWLVQAPEIVAWKAEPAEARPGASITLHAGVLDPTNALDVGATTWAFCHAAKPVDEDRVVTPSCLEPVVPDAAGNPVTLTLPTDACQIYGPDTAQPAPGAPPTRPRDPDATGGYYQPVTIALGDALSLGLARVSCDLPNASLQTARAFQAAYRANENPALGALTFADETGPLDPGALPAGGSVQVQATWAAGAIETYVLYDQASHTVAEIPETLAAAWYVTGGTLDRPTMAVTDPSVLSATTTWQLPPAASALHLGFVLRDSRGGSDFVLATVTTTDAGR